MQGGKPEFSSVFLCFVSLSFMQLIPSAWCAAVAPGTMTSPAVTLLDLPVLCLTCLLPPSAAAAVSCMQEYKYRRGHQPCLDSGGGCSSSAFHGRVQYNAEEEGTMMLVCSGTYVAPFSQERYTHVRATLTFVSSLDGPKSSFFVFFFLSILST